MAEGSKTKKKDKKDKARNPQNPYGNYKFDRNKKVTQSTIDMIKDTARKDGIEAAIKKHGSSNAEAVKRLYGQRRYDMYATKGSKSGGSMPRDTYMNKGVSARRTPQPGSTPGTPAGTGSRQKTSRSKSTTRQKAGAVGAGAAALYTTAYQQAKRPATGVISGRARANPKLPAGRPARTAYNSAIKSGKSATAALTAAKAAAKKATATPASRRALALRAGSRLLGAAAAPVLARDAIMAGSGALKKGIAKTKGGTAALKRLNKSGGTGSGRAAQMKNIKRKTRGR
jgi:hypothetical protein